MWELSRRQRLKNFGYHCISIVCWELSQLLIVHTFQRQAWSKNRFVWFDPTFVIFTVRITFARFLFNWTRPEHRGRQLLAAVLSLVLVVFVVLEQHQTSPAYFDSIIVLVSGSHRLVPQKSLLWRVLRRRQLFSKDGAFVRTLLCFFSANIPCFFASRAFIAVENRVHHALKVVLVTVQVQSVANNNWQSHNTRVVLWRLGYAVELFGHFYLLSKVTQ